MMSRAPIYCWCSLSEYKKPTTSVGAFFFFFLWFSYTSCVYSLRNQILMKQILILSLLIFVSCTNNIATVELEEIPLQEVRSLTWTLEIQKEPMIAQENNIPPQDECILFDDFTNSPDFRWGIVNDGVMWGKSKWNLAIEDEKLIFSWTIVTRWGGFSSLRGWLKKWILSEYNSVKLRAKSDGREYRITFRDNNRRGISHRAVILFQTPWEFEEITINFDDLQPAYFGRIVNATSFNKQSAREIGVMLSDWVDGAFSLEIDEVRFCK